MAHFYGSIQGSRGKASRLGTKTSGLTLVAASWQGAIQTYLYEQDGEDRARVSFIQWHNGAGINKVLYDGPVNGAPETQAAD